MRNWSSREDGDCLVSTGCKWLQTRSNRLFVRSCYPALLQECQTLFRGHIQGVFLVGTPGIGKSVFLDYVLHKYLQDGKTVLYLHGPEERAFVFRPDGTIEEHLLAAALGVGVNMADNVDVVLYDPHEDSAKTNSIHISFFREKNFIVVMSPDKKSCKKLRKDTSSQAMLYMGTYSFQEAEALRSSCYPHVPTDLLLTRYAEIGGIVRHLIRRPLPNKIDPVLAEVGDNQVAALKIIVDQPFIIDAGEVASQFRSLWSIYHFQPVSNADGATDYYNYTIELCCNDARIRIRDMLMKKEVKDLWDIYDRTIERQGTLRGIRYEAYAHKKILVYGINGTATSLTKHGEGTSRKQVKIPPGLTKLTLPSNELGIPFQNALNSARQLLPAGGYLLPETSNFPVIDSLFASSNATISLQMKAGRSKPLSGTPANSIYAMAGGCLVFVVPDESIIRKKLAYSEGAGPSQLRHYRIVLKESQ